MMTEMKENGLWLWCLAPLLPPLIYMADEQKVTAREAQTKIENIRDAYARDGAEEVIDVGDDKQILLAADLIDRLSNLEHKLGEVIKHPDPVLTADRPWESSVTHDRLVSKVGCAMVHRDPETGRFQMWYQGGADQCLYATSEDGIHWEKPVLGLVEHEGSTSNNIIRVKITGDAMAENTDLVDGFSRHLHGGGVIYDRGDPDPKRRYKTVVRSTGTYELVAREKGSDPNSFCYRACYSRDGIQWTVDDANRAMQASDDTPSTVMDELNGQYVFYRRSWVGGARAVGIATSKDFVTWTPFERDVNLILAADAEDQRLAVESGAIWKVIYSFKGFPDGGVSVGAPQVFTVTRPAVWHNLPDSVPGTEDGLLNCELAWSRNNRHFHRAFQGKPLIPFGPNNAFDCASIDFPARPVRVGDEIWFYYSARDGTHGCMWYGNPARDPPEQMRGGAIGLARMRLDGWALVEADVEGGELLTTPISFTGSRLWINADAKDGEVRTELVDRQEKPLAGFTAADCKPIVSDSVRHEVQWTESPDLAQYAGTPLRLRFHLRNARLYSFRFGIYIRRAP